MNTIACIAVVLCVAAVECSVLPAAYHGGFYYHGAYPGKCGEDGMYLNDAYSFVVCTNGNAYVRPCAPGSANGPSKDYKVGDYYTNGEFCNINLNDYAHHGYNGAAAVPVAAHYKSHAAAPAYPHYYGHQAYQPYAYQPYAYGAFPYHNGVQRWA